MHAGPSTDNTRLGELESAWLASFAQRTTRSRDQDARCSGNLAIGQRQRFSSGLPNPIYIETGQGAYFDDLDGNRYLDLTAGWNAAMLGRGHPAVAEAVGQAMASIGAPGGAMHPSRLRDELAAEVCDRVPGAERLAFAPSGSEANQFAVRLARARTGKEAILRCEGGYHGQYDYLVGGEMPRKGLPSAVAQAVAEVPFNDADAAISELRRLADRLCAVIVEPMMTIPGAVEQRFDFLQSIRTEAADLGVPFILDEVITGFRFAAGGAAEYYGIDPPPDIAVLGKMLGGGLPVAAIAGRAQIVEQVVSMSNTHAQNPVCIAAGLASLRQLDSDSYARVCALGLRLRDGLSEIAADLPIDLQVTGDGPCCGLHFTREQVLDHATASRADRRLWRLMCVGMANEGYCLSSRTFGPIDPYSEEDVDACLAAFARTLANVAAATD